MASKQNPFERIRDRAGEEYKKTAESFDKAFGAGNTPYASVKLNRRQKAEYWKSKSQEEQYQMWQGWNDDEKDEFIDEVYPLLGGDKRG